MSLKSQRPIRFVNNCNCIVDNNELAEAILWFSDKPVISMKRISLHGVYPCVSIGAKKIHIHRLLVMYRENRRALPTSTHVHHINGNKLDCSKGNLELVDGPVHTSCHNKGRAISDNTRLAIIRFNQSRKGYRAKQRRPDITPQIVFQKRNEGMSFNQISILYNLDWGCVKQRYQDAIHDNPELLKEK